MTYVSILPPPWASERNFPAQEVKDKPRHACKHKPGDTHPAGHADIAAQLRRGLEIRREDEDEYLNGP